MHEKLINLCRKLLPLTQWRAKVRDESSELIQFLSRRGEIDNVCVCVCVCVCMCVCVWEVAARLWQATPSSLHSSNYRVTLTLTNKTACHKR